MNENKWLACASPGPMLKHLRGKASDRKIRLFMVACCRQIWHLIEDVRSRRAVDAAERYAEGRISPELLQVFRADAQAAFLDAKCAEYRGEAEAEFCYTAAYHGVCATLFAVAAARATVLGRLDQGIDLLYAYHDDETQWPQRGGRGCDYWARSAVGAAEKKGVFLAHGLTGNEHPTSGDVHTVASAAEEAIEADAAKNQAYSLRHIVGNSFRRLPAQRHWPATVVQLARAFEDGQNCGFALHDALLDVGHADLADHFRQEQTHPKGCWVLDLLLGKE